ncbi:MULTISPECIES: FAD assembly factor SdhE [Legionella]|uniref:FAD assembly factor SdhE n=1 Tax=Legionella septentrionalis TaxID=2498109 RepID=A0A433JKR0_9GAMM|nr:MULTISPECIES: succinate dehydrogenase assembly factor 2 [Legionella]MCP0914474.1 succinate dehydrogenase assembly factor 2 [Legionella sp. 27cVA30]RUQ89463.1 succinate dehydrogenase assembly factor 2 [Legionella septentrionalis]RUQ97304.1 succinate dehydrogenase assembly factor 2 [Legionella septentrionalis]RUR10476.1 succinate dehydrogenase assembly factor 2 [Legionella septentrionalis]RUR16096.1 succinate dehydrogenase assembly factor 2 [Legionella septentrionalis]
MKTSFRKAKISWNCRRGMLELDLLLTRFLANGFDRLTEEQVDLFEQLLNYSDPELYACLMGQMQPAEEFSEIVSLIRFHSNP